MQVERFGSSALANESLQCFTTCGNGRCPSLNSLSMSFVVADDNLRDEDLKPIMNALRSPMCFIKEFDITDGPFSDEFINSVQVFMSNMQVARRMIALRSATTRLGRASAMRNLPSELIRLVI